MTVSNDNSASVAGLNCFKEAVCIDTKRIYDSCSDKDCLEDLHVYFTNCTQHIIDQAISVKAKKIEILNVYLDVESVPFNKGFYSVDMTFFFLVKLNAYTSPIATPVPVAGLATFSKKVILFGSEGNVRVYCSDRCHNDCCVNNMPKASVQVVDPICLSVKLCECPECPLEPILSLPECVCNCFEGSFTCERPCKIVLITIGLFSIVQIERCVQMMIPAYDFCVPDKESMVANGDDPCELFKRIKFPTNEFFPPKLTDIACDD